MGARRSGGTSGMVRTVEVDEHAASMPSPHVKQLDEAIATHLAPIAEALGLKPTKYPHPIKPGHTVRVFGRPLVAPRDLHWTIWSRGKDTGDVSWTLQWFDGAFWRDVKTMSPTSGEGGWAPVDKPLAIQQSGFFPRKSPAHFDRMVAFIGRVMKRNAGAIAEQVPELRPEIDGLVAGAWRDAVREAEDAWLHRVVWDVDETELPMTIHFVGQSLLTLVAEDRRVSFKLRTDGITKTDVVHVSRWWKNPADTWSAMRLRVGDRVWDFDPEGRLVSA
jgi:hypothetical protein